MLAAAQQGKQPSKEISMLYQQRLRLDASLEAHYSPDDWKAIQETWIETLDRLQSPEGDPVLCMSPEGDPVLWDGEQHTAEPFVLIHWPLVVKSWNRVQPLCEAHWEQLWALGGWEGGKTGPAGEGAAVTVGKMLDGSWQVWG